MSVSLLFQGESEETAGADGVRMSSAFQYFMSTENNSSTTPESSNVTSNFSNIIIPFCQSILSSPIEGSRVRIWDVMILVPNALFFFFLLLRMRANVAMLVASSSPIFTAFYGLVFVVSVISVLRCVVSMTVNAAVEEGKIVDKMLWLILRFFLLGTEASVIIFGIYFGHLDSKTSIRRVLVCTSLFALAYSAIQGTLELKYSIGYGSVSNNPTGENYDLFAHGGMIFLSTSSIFFSVVYIIVLILPLTPARERFNLPSKPSFYYFVATLAVLNLVQAVGSLLLYERVFNGLCVIDVTTYIYFTLFDPLVYGTFLWGSFRTTHPSILFSYKHQVDEVVDDDLSLPYQTPFGKYEPDTMVVDGSSVGSTHFEYPANRQSAPYISVNSGDLRPIAT